MAKRKNASKVQKRAKLRRGSLAKRGKARKVTKAARGKATKRTVAGAKPKPVAVKKARKQPVAPAVDTAAVEVIEQPVAVMEVEETRKAS
jgi:hypothetical protein